MTYKIDFKELQEIVSSAKDNMFKLSLPLYISDKELEQGQLPTVAILEAVLMFLNSKKLLTKLTEVDYTIIFDDNDSEPLEERNPTQ